jgi:hypothetical protein
MISDHTHDHHTDLLKGLQSEDTLRVIETLEDLKVSGKASDVPQLIELLHQTQDLEIKSKINSLFANLKEREAVPLIIEAIQNQKYAPERKELLACCWENGLDYSNYLSLFVDLLIENDFVIAFEAYTVIVNMTERIYQEKIDTEIGRLEQAIQSTTDQKIELMREVVDFLPSIIL